MTHDRSCPSKIQHYIQIYDIPWVQTRNPATKSPKFRSKMSDLTYPKHPINPNNHGSDSLSLHPLSALLEAKDPRREPAFIERIEIIPISSRTVGFGASGRVVVLDFGADIRQPFLPKRHVLGTQIDPAFARPCVAA